MAFSLCHPTVLLRGGMALTSGKDPGHSVVLGSALLAEWPEGSLNSPSLSSLVCKMRTGNDVTNP